MLDMHKEYLHNIMGLQPVHAKLIDSGAWSFAARKRYWFTSANGIAKPARSVDWNTKDWTPLPALENGKLVGKFVKLGPWLTVQRKTHTGQCVRTMSAYKLNKLVYHLPTFGGIEGLARLLTLNMLQQAVVDRLPIKCREPFLFIQRHEGPPNETTDQATATLACYLEQELVALPFRLPNLSEVSREAEVDFIFQQSPALSEIMHEEHKLSLIGNFFKPSAFETAILGQPDSAGFLHFCKAATGELLPSNPVTIQQVLTLHADLLKKVKMMLKTENSKAHNLSEDIVPSEYS
jgi:hypothetical protein